MTHEHSLDEFESIFEQASIPVLHIEEVPLNRLAVVLKNDPLDGAILDLACYFQERFGSAVRVHWPTVMGSDQAATMARDRGLEPAGEPFASTAELVGQVSIGRNRLVLLPEPERETARVVALDALVEGTVPPILVVRRPLAAPADVFGRILHALTGNFQQTQNFSYSFTLAEEPGAILLLHAVNDTELEDVRDTLRVSPRIHDEAGEDLLGAMARHGEQFLKGVVAASRKAPYDVSYRIVVGQVTDVVRRELSERDYGLVVVGRHAEGYSHVSADDYQLMHAVRDIPVLAL